MFYVVFMFSGNYYSPDSPQLELHKVLSVEDVLASRMVRPVGRVTQAFPDGTLLLELIRPPNGPFGFVISRGKGRPDTGKKNQYPLSLMSLLELLVAVISLLVGPSENR